MRVDKFRLLFFGSDAFSIRVLGPLINENICPVRIVTKPHTLLDKYSSERNLPLHYWQPGLVNINSDVFNIGLVASFGQMIDPAAVQRFQYGLFNTHPSLLPQYRGSTPVQAAVFDRLKQTGCTIMKIPPIEKFDIGQIISQQTLDVRPREYAIDLRDRLGDLGASMVIDLLLNYEQRLKQARSQNDHDKSFARKLKPEQGCLKFKQDSIDLIDRKVLAYTGFVEIYTECLNGLYVQLDGFSHPDSVKKLNVDKLIQLSGASTSQEIAPGTMYFHKRRGLLCIKAADNEWTAFEWATPEGKAKMSARDFCNGYLSRLASGMRMTDL